MNTKDIPMTSKTMSPAKRKYERTCELVFEWRKGTRMGFSQLPETLKENADLPALERDLICASVISSVPLRKVARRVLYLVAVERVAATHGWTPGWRKFFMRNPRKPGYDFGAASRMGEFAGKWQVLLDELGEYPDPEWFAGAPVAPSEPSVGAVPKGMRFQVLQRDGMRCQYCGVPATQGVLHVDHIVPRAKGGATIPENLITACVDCNSGKGVKMISADVILQLAKKGAR